MTNMSLLTKTARVRTHAVLSRIRAILSEIRYDILQPPCALLFQELLVGKQQLVCSLYTGLEKDGHFGWQGIAVPPSYQSNNSKASPLRPGSRHPVRSSRHSQMRLLDWPNTTQSRRRLLACQFASTVWMLSVRRLRVPTCARSLVHQFVSH